MACRTSLGVYFAIGTPRFSGTPEYLLKRPKNGWDIPGGNHSSIDAALPFQAVGDTVTKTPVKLPSGKIGTMVDMNFVPAQHPELTCFAQKALFLPAGVGDGDLLVFTAEGTPDAMKSQDSEITSIFASYQALDSTPSP